MNAYVNLYMNNPTKGNTDGTPISLDSTGAAPLSVTLDATANEHKILKCAIRCEEGYKTEGNVVLAFEGTTADKWSVAKDKRTFSAINNCKQSLFLLYCLQEIEGNMRGGTVLDEK